MKKILLVMILLLLGLSACSNAYDSEPMPILLVIPTPVVSPTVTPIPPTITPSPLVTATAEPFHLSLGYFDREPACVAVTEIVVRLLKERVDNITVEQIEYDRRSNALYDGLAARTKEQEIDLTLCFYDPTDRIYLRLFIEELKQIGATVWQDEEVRMLIIANQKSRIILKNEHPCLYRFFQRLDFGDVPVEQLEAEQWIATHSEQVESSLSCEGVSPTSEEG